MAVDRSQKALAEFVSEAQGAIDALGHDLLRLEAAPGAEPDQDLLNAVFRAAHSLKGLAAMFGVERMERLAHALEDVLDEVRLGRRRLDRAGVDLLLETPEVLSRIVAEEGAGEAPRTADAAARLAERLRAHGGAAPGWATDPLDALAVGAELRAVLTDYEAHRLRANVARGHALYRVRAAFDLADFDRGLSDLGARLKQVGELISTLPSSDPGGPRSLAFELLVASPAPADQIRREAGPGASVEQVEGAAPARPGGAAPAGASPAPDAAAEEPGSLRSASRAVRVDIGKLDQLMALVGELGLARTSLRGLADRLKAAGGDPGLAAELHVVQRTLERRLDELQAGLLEVRMVPLEPVFEKLARMVRRIAREVGKDVELAVSGGAVELDKLIVEALSDPLVHLIRNAVDHGIEPPAVRARAGKPAAGRLRVAAVQRGSRVEISVEDDGAGMDEQRIREVAVQRGIVGAEGARGLSRREAMNLVFAPGFSTARQVTPLSGRGVGLDVVKNNVAALSGIIDLHTEPGRGTRFELLLPVTLAIVRALVVAAGGRTYALPVGSVLEIVEVRAPEIRGGSGREAVTVRGATVPMVRLDRHLGLAGGEEPERLFVVVVGLAQERVGLAVHGVQGQQDVVVKPLGPMLQGIRGVAGATDLGNRRTVLVLDVGAIIEDVASAEGRREATG